MIADQAIITYQGTWTLGSPWSGPQGVASTINAIIAILTAAGLVSRTTPATTGSTLTDLAQTADVGDKTFSVTLSLQVENGMGFSSSDDAVSIIRNAVYQTVGSFPLSDSVPYVQNPGDTSSQATGQPGAAPKQPVNCATVSFFSDPAGWLSCAESKVTSGIMFVGIGLIAAIILITAHDHKAV
jgi:hypothetical protein